MSQRFTIALSFIFCIAALAVGFYLEHYFNFVPCALCVLQRICLGVLAVLFFIAWCRVPLRSLFFPILAFVFSLSGALLAFRQVWLQHHPGPEGSGACLPGMTFLFKTLPFHKAVWETLKGSNECGQVHGTLLGFSLPMWSLGAFVLLILLSLRLFKKVD